MNKNHYGHKNVDNSATFLQKNVEHTRGTAVNSKLNYFKLYQLTQDKAGLQK